MRILFAALIVFQPFASLAAWAADPAPVGASRGMVVSAQHIASDVGADVLRRGGNAVDAAVAVGYALAVVYPEAGNLGGGGFLTLRLADGTATFLDFREKAPLAATPTMFVDGSGKPVPGLSTDSWKAVGVPGTPMGLEAARAKYGTLPRAVLLAPAIKLARDGFALEAGDLGILRLLAPALAKDPAAAAIFLPGGHVPAPGYLLRQPDLARSLAALSIGGPGAVYTGPVGRAIVAASTAGGGILAKADFTHYGVRWLPPVECDYRGYHVISAPPPSSGGVTLCEMLTILQGFDLGAMGFHSAAEIHVLAEAMRRAFNDRDNRLGDPAFVHNPVAELINPAYAAKLRAGIDPLKATPSASLAPAAPPAAEGKNTTQYSVVDAAGNAASVTYTLNGWFGSLRVAPGTGIVMNNEMDDFSTKPGAANMFGLVQGDTNAVAPGKTPLSSMTPTILTHDGKLAAVIGSPGGPRIITAVLEVILNLVDHGMNIQEAIDAPRVHMQFLPDVISIEPDALSPDTRALLEQRGYHFAPAGHWAMAEGIVAGGPALTKPGTATQALPMPLPYAPDATLFGAADVRGPTGKASGVN